MARVERITSTTPVPVEQAQLIDASAFRFSTAGVQALQQAGGILGELGKRELEAKNSLAVTAAVESRRLAKLKMEEFIKNNPDPDTWSKGAFDIINEQSATFSQQKFNSKTLKEQKIEQDAFKDQLNMNVGIAAVSQNIDNAIVTSGKNVIDAISTDDDTPEAADEIEKLIELHQKDLERKYTKEVAAIHLEKTLEQAKKAFYIDQSKLDPDATIVLMKKKKKALGKAGKDKEGLGAKDYDDIIASAYSAKLLAKKSNDTLAEEQKDKIGRQISYPDPEVDTIALIEASTALTEDEQYIQKQRYHAEVERKFKSLSRSKAVITDEVAKAKLESKAYSVRIGGTSIEEFQQELDEALGRTIDKDAHDELLEIAEGKLTSYQAQTVTTLIGEAEKQLIDIRTELDVFAAFQGITDKKERERILSDRQIQYWWSGQYRKALNTRIIELRAEQKREITISEIYKEAKILLTDYRGKTVNEIKEILGKKQTEILESKKDVGKAFKAGFELATGQAAIIKALSIKKPTPTGADIIGTLEGTSNQKRAINAVVGKAITPDMKQALISQILNNERIKVKDNAGKLYTLPAEQLADWLAIKGNTLAVE